MREKLKYFILNKAYDFNRGIYENMKLTDNKLCFTSVNESGVGRFLTRIFDSNDRGMKWHRLLINAENCNPEDFRIVIFSSDEDMMKYDGHDVPISFIFHNSDFSLDEKLKLFAPFVKKRISGVTDALLHDVSGRYIWAFIEAYSSSEKPIALKDVRIYLPAESWIDSLPEIYRRNDGESHFLERYLGIFQTLYEELDYEIENIAYYFDPECAEMEFLQWLSEWIDISDSHIWPEEKLRKLLLKAVGLYRKRGTKESLVEIIELFTGEKPFIVEDFSIRKFKGTQAYSKTLVPMYGNDPYKITVMIRSECIKSDSDLNVIRKIASEMLPVSMELNLVVLEPYIFLDKFAYIGVNSVLGQHRNAVLDGKSQITLTKI